MAVRWIVTGDEVVEVDAFECVFLEREMLVGAEIINPELCCPRFLSCGFAVEEEDVRLDALRVEDAGWQTQQRVNVCLFEEFTADGFTCAAFEENIIRNNNRGAAVLLQDREDMLEEIELLVAGARPEIVAMHDE